MFNVTEPAVQAVAEYFKTMDVRPIRVFLTQGCGGQQLAMALDEVKPSDNIHEENGYQFVMDKELLSQAQPVEIDYANMGFKISSSLELGGGCQSCGSAGSCCSG
ncbi:HesB-like protein [Desulfosarcina variabilis str. Montpellier]|uniref:IscA/HesB family protein n=1 Tax=Desulfosarcina variabilis TaxID=2300 RepID=UPI003AFB3236